ncbi:MAG: TetR/AcrR family transcriptional regulator [Scrofimicrobium sp.]
MSAPLRPSQRATRRRGAELLEVIYSATAEELAENGFDGVTFDRVARRAQMSKATIYRRFRSPAHLIAEMLSADATRMDFRPTGSLRDDLVQIMNLAVETVDSFGVETYRRLIGHQDESLEALLPGFGILAGFDLVDRVVTDAQERGEIGPGPIPQAARRVPIELLHSKLLVTHGRDTLVEDIVDAVTIPLFQTYASR